MPKGKPKIEIKFEFVAKCIIDITVIEKLSGINKKIQLNFEDYRTSEKERNRLIEELKDEDN